MPINKITDATVEPFTLAEAKLHLKVETAITEDDSLITALIKAVRLACEGQCRRTLLQTTWELAQDKFSTALMLEHPRIIGVDSIKYIDANGVEQTLDPQDYLVDKDSEPGWVVPAYDKRWPDTRCQLNAVRVRYRAGYGTEASAVPEDLKVWMKLHLAHYYKNREASISGTTVTPLPFASGLLDPYLVWTA